MWYLTSHPIFHAWVVVQDVLNWSDYSNQECPISQQWIQTWSWLFSIWITIQLGGVWLRWSSPNCLKIINEQCRFRWQGRRSYEITVVWPSLIPLVGQFNDFFKSRWLAFYYYYFFSLSYIILSPKGCQSLIF